MNNYNLQPLSPNMITRAPMSAYMGSVRAAAANLGNPTGNPGQGALETLESRLAELSRMSQLEAQLAEQQAAGKSMEQNAQLLGRKDQMEHETGMAQEELDHKKGLDEQSLLSQIVEKTAGFQSIGDALGVLADSQRPDPTDLEAVKNYKPNMGARALAWLNTQMGKMIPGVQKAQMARDAAYELQVKAAEGTASADDYLANYETQSLEQFGKLGGLIAEMEKSTSEQTRLLAAEAMGVLREIGYQGRAIEILKDLEGVGGMGHEEGAGPAAQGVEGAGPAAQDVLSEYRGKTYSSGAVPTLSGATKSVFDHLAVVEGDSGDTTDTVETGTWGVTQSARNAVGADDDVPDEVVAAQYIDYLDKKMPPEFEDAPDYVREAVLDSGYNYGESSMRWNAVLGAAKRRDWVGVGKSYLDHATIKKQTSKGIARRRAESYNLIASHEGGTLITEITQKDGGVIVYTFEDDTTHTASSSKGRHKDSEIGSEAPRPRPNQSTFWSRSKALSPATWTDYR